MAHLLLADDSATIQKVVELCFAEENIQVHSLGDGASALEYIRDHAVDVLLADVSLPFVNGYELCREIRQNPRTADVPVVLLVGTFEPFDAERARQCGCQSHLTKPFETSRLVELVKGLLVKPAPVQVPETPKKVEQRIAGLLFHIPVANGRQDTVFSLTLQQCRPAFTLFRRLIQVMPIRTETPAAAAAAPEAEAEDRSVPLTAHELDLVVSQVIARLPDELRRLVPEIAREVLTRHPPK